MNQHLNDKCGIFAIFDYYDMNKNIYQKMLNGLVFLQHRGRESAGISYIKNNTITTFKNIGLVKDIFENFNDEMNIAIGHIRYSTRKKNIDTQLFETQPIEGITKFGNFSLAHNGNIPFIENIKKKFNIDFNTESDTIILTKIIEKLQYKYDNFHDILIHLLNSIEGVYCLAILINNEIYAIRDSYGVRPLCIGKNKNGGFCISSESNALQDYELIRDINAGEIINIKFDNNGFINMKTIYQKKIDKLSFCSFEYIYFMRNNSINNHKKIKDIRFELGFELGLQEIHVDRTAIVLSIPNTAIAGAKGFAKAVKLDYYDYIEKRKDAGRTFILPTDKERIDACDKKFIYHNNLKDLNVYIIDDSIVRGNTLKSILKKLREVGVRKVHLRITAPPVVSECYYGIDVPTKRELIAHNKSILDIRKEFGVTSLKYIDIKTMKKIFDQQVCTSCFNGKYNDKLLEW